MSFFLFVDDVVVKVDVDYGVVPNGTFAGPPAGGTLDVGTSPPVPGDVTFAIPRAVLPTV